MKILVTGAAGFIGMHVAQRMLQRGDSVVGIDNLNDYYDVSLKHARLAELRRAPAFQFEPIDVADRPALEALFAQQGFARVVHLGAQAGVRYSLTHPHAYAQSNLVGFLNILECCRHERIEHLVYASSSSVYGGNARMPLREGDGVDHPVSLYAATKRANELMAHTYSHLYQLPTTGLRFFTVYGPWGRPDMAYFKFARAILAGEPIPVFNHGQLERDFTYIDDIVDGVVGVLDQPARADAAYDPMNPDPATSTAPFRVLNIGNEQPVKLLTFIETLEQALGRTAIKEMLPMQPGDVLATHADTSRLASLLGGHRPSTPLAEGLRRFAAWYLEHQARSR
jgi:UDP-glucuronate 4-epimerase